MFWGGISREKASASLRSALHLLRKDLALLGPDVVVADRNLVSLVPARISAASEPVSKAECLEGMELDVKDGEGFEHWLSAARQARQDALPGEALAESRTVTAPEPIAPKPSRRIALGLSPVLHAGLAPSQAQWIDAVLDAFSRFASYTTLRELHDLRGCDDPSAALPIESGVGPTHLLHFTAACQNRQLTLTFRLTEAASRRILWVSDPIDTTKMPAEEIAADVAETTIGQLATSSVSPNAPNLFPWTAITALFTLDEPSIRRTEAKIERMVDSGAPAVLECLRMFAQVSKEGEGVEPSTTVSAEKLSDIIAAVPTSNPLLPTWLSLAGYSAHMLLGENDLADLSLNEAYRRAPNLSLNLDHLAVVKMTRDDIYGAEKAFQRCLQVGTSSPWRYTYDVTGAMIATAKGDYVQSLEFANRALMRKPTFIGASRYAMAGSALAGEHEDARALHARILRLRPEYDMGAWTENMVRRRPYDSSDALVASFERDGII